MPTPDEKLLKACEGGNIKEAVEALKDGADPNCIDTDLESTTPLMYAAEAGNAELLALLLEKGALVQKNIEVIAKAYGKPEIQEMLIKSNPEFIRSVASNNGHVIGVLREKRRRNLESKGKTYEEIQDDEIIKESTKYIDYLHSLRQKAISQMHGSGKSRRRRRKRTYRRRTFKR
jgi:ankyrin repeat protein